MKNRIIILLISICLASCANSNKEKTSKKETQIKPQNKKVLVYTKTLGWRHQSIETGVKTFKTFGETHHFEVVHTEDSLHFVNTSLPQYDAIIFLNTTGNVLDAKGQQAFEKYIQGGGSFLGVHSAADTEYDWPWYGKLVGGYFESHPNDPNIRTATVLKTKEHASTAHIPTSYSTQDEWYNYKNLNPNTETVLTLDETSYEGGTNGDFHPIAWFHYYDGGKAFYTGGGHDKTKYSDPIFRKHLEQALLWCLE